MTKTTSDTEIYANRLADPAVEAARDTPKHNSGAVYTRDMLVSVVERVERLEEEKQGITDDIGEVYKEAKGNGLDAPTIKRVIRLRNMDPEKRKEQEALLDLYMSALEGE